jgi:hypothetical protein
MGQGYTAYRGQFKIARAGRSHSNCTYIELHNKFCKAFGGIPCAKPIEMAHFNQASHTASGALATSGMRSLLEATIPVLPEAEQN